MFRGRTLCDKAPGLSFLGAPVYALHRGVARLVGHALTFPEVLKVLRVFSVALPSLLLLLLIYWGLGLIDADDRVRLPILAAYALGTTVHTYSVLLFSHALAAGPRGTRSRRGSSRGAPWSASTRCSSRRSS